MVRAAYSASLRWVPVLRVAKGAVPTVAPASSAAASDGPSNDVNSNAISNAFPPSPCDVQVLVNRDTWGLGLVSFKAVATLLLEDGAVAPSPRAPSKAAGSFLASVAGDAAGDAAVDEDAVRDVFECIWSFERRQEWDVILHDSTLVERIDDHNAIRREVFEPLSEEAGGTRHDYALLTSWRSSGDGSYVLANRSVVDDRVPPVPGFQRGEVLPSGFILEPIYDDEAKSPAPDQPEKQQQQQQPKQQQQQQQQQPKQRAVLGTRVTYLVQMNPAKTTLPATPDALPSLALLLQQNMASLATTVSQRRRRTTESTTEGADHHQQQQQQQRRQEETPPPPPAASVEQQKQKEKKKKKKSGVLARLQRQFSR